jgi:hypothetical protein
VLVPHRDVRLPLREWSGALFAAGLCGAWSFPWVSPLALAAKPFSSDELKILAGNMRNLAESSGGKFISGNAAPVLLDKNISVFGPALNMALPGLFFPPRLAAKIKSRFSPLALGAALLHGEEPPPALPPPLSFRAAALANMVIRPLASGNAEDRYSFEWKIGPLRWLPPAKKQKG